MNIIKEFKASDKTMLLFTAFAFLGLVLMNLSAGSDKGVYAGLVLTILSAAGAAVYHRTKNKKVKTDLQIKPVKIS
ncbi:hypothetical protein ACSAZL_01285 [Methanosarcina sp. T3]|uniref:hypothetical protein n=1 Tax=Methanosarcina sp. T3 TaxID=3439062 RepID=UPI003F835AD2